MNQSGAGVDEVDAVCGVGWGGVSGRKTQLWTL